jgi:hypothetical protein
MLGCQGEPIVEEVAVVAASDVGVLVEEVVAQVQVRT